MEYKIYQLFFNGAVHFGNNSLEESEYTFTADTLFSALCLEAVKAECLPDLVRAVKEDKLLLSDAFPCIGEELYLPKPMIHIEQGKEAGDSTIKKAYKKLSFVPLSDFDSYLKGEFPIMERAEELKKLGKMDVRVSAAVRGEEETKPFRIGTYQFSEDCGLYVIVAGASDSEFELFELLMDGLSYAGIGGKRSQGLGRFDYFLIEMDKDLEKRLKGSGRSMNLSVALPREDEIEQAVAGASYLLKKRSGFVASEQYAPTLRKKKELYVFQSGSVFPKRFSGDVYDVSEGGNHPVYRYAKPLFMEV